MKNSARFSPKIFLISLFLYAMPTQSMQQPLLESKEREDAIQLSEIAHSSPQNSDKEKEKSSLCTRICFDFPSEKSPMCCIASAAVCWGGLIYGGYYLATHPPAQPPAPFQPSTFCTPQQNSQNNFTLNNQPWTFQASNHITGIHAQGDTYCNFNGTAADAANAVVKNCGDLFAKDSSVCVTTVDPITPCISYEQTHKSKRQSQQSRIQKLSAVINSRHALKRQNQTQQKYTKKNYQRIR